MLPFAELKDYAKKVDVGIDRLERRLQNPYGLQNEDSKMKASEIIENIETDIKSVEDFVDDFKEAEKKNIEENAKTVQFAQNVMADMENTFREIRDLFPDLAAGPFEKRCNNGKTLESFSLNASSEVEGIVLDCSSSFRSPNYSSTPEVHGHSKGTPSHFPSSSFLYTPRNRSSRYK